MSGRADFDVKDRVKQATDVVELIGTSIDLAQRGKVFKGLCPFHDDHDPSFTVDPERQSWACFVCDLRGDVFDFVMRREGVEFFESLKILAERAGIQIKPGRKIEKGSPEDKATLFRAMKWAEEEYHQCLLHSEAASPVRDYLAERGILQSSIETFKIGFAPLSWSWLVDRARQTPYSPEILAACGLVAPNQQGGWYERFRGRVLFPIRDTLERPIGLGGRVVPSLYGEGEEVPPAKYVNSPETRLFSKSHNLYALNLCRSYLQKSEDKQLTVVEGYTDVIGAWQAGLRNVVACLGTAINENHIRLIKRFASGVTLVLDGDEAGQKRTNEVLDLFVSSDVDLRILTLPEGQDPFDFLQREGAGRFQEMVSAAPDAIAHKIQMETAGIDLVRDTHRANQALENILKTLARQAQRPGIVSHKARIRQDQIEMRLARTFQLGQEQIALRLAELRKSDNRIPRGSEQPQRKSMPTRWNRNEAELLQLILRRPHLLDAAIEKIVPADFQPGELRELYEEIEAFYHEGEGLSYHQLMLALEGSPLKATLDRLQDEIQARERIAQQHRSDLQADDDAQLESIIEVFQRRHEAGRQEEAISQLHSGTLSADEQNAALLALFQQQQQRQRPAKPQ